MRPDQSPDPSPDPLPAPIAFGAFFAASARGDALIELHACSAHLSAECPLSFFSHREFLAALRARFPGARVEPLEACDARRARVFVADPANAITPEEAERWDALSGGIDAGPPDGDEIPFAAPVGTPPAPSRRGQRMPRSTTLRGWKRRCGRWWRLVDA